MRLILLYFLFLSNLLQSQTIKGNFPNLAQQNIKLQGFNGLKTYAISSTQIDEKGDFKLTYSNTDFGVGYLISQDNKPLFVILSGENIEIIGESLSSIGSIQIIKGKENLWFEKYAKEHPRREQALSAWIYLENMYAVDSLFINHQETRNVIQQEKLRIKNEDNTFLASLPEESYVRWFLPVRKLVSSVSTVTQYRPEEIPETIKAFRELDYTTTKLYKSGLFKDAIESHFWFIENSGNSIDKVFDEMKISIDAMMENLVTNEKKLNEVTDYLFDLLERHSLFQASEYLALKVLNEVSCTINDDLSKQLETYRAMKKGNIAPDIIFESSFFVNENKIVDKLSNLKSQYNVIVFGGSWCPKCKEELPEIASLYNKWQSKGVEVVFIALEDDKKSFMDFAGTFPFFSYSDLRKWDGSIVNDYYVFATPTIFLLNDKREIILRPNSVKQMDAWVDWYFK